MAEGLREVHAAGFLHRDVKPSNIFVRRSDESPVLLDFGSARQALGRKSRSMTAIATAGYSPPEQYESQGGQGAWTDIYALCALCHRAITGEVPVEAPRRTGELARSRADPLERLAAAAGVAGYSPGFLKAVDLGLRLAETERPQSVEDWLALLEEGATSVKDASLGQETADGIDSSSEHGSTEDDADLDQENASKDAKTGGTGIVGRLVGGSLGLARTYWLFGFVANLAFFFGGFLVASNTALGFNTNAVRSSLSNDVLEAMAELLQQNHVPEPIAVLMVAGVMPPYYILGFNVAVFLVASCYWVTVSVGIWRAAGAYHGLRLWADLARTHVAAQAVLMLIATLTYLSDVLVA